jgi:addiction module HigA family antidote
MTKTAPPVIHPGELLAEILAQLGLSQAAFARAVGVSPMRISHVIRGTRPVAVELALLFGRALTSRRNTGSTSRPATI